MQDFLAWRTYDPQPTILLPRYSMLVTDFEQFSRTENDLRVTLQEACRIVSIGVRAACVGVMQYHADERAFVLEAGIGWSGHQIGRTRIAADFGTAAGTCWILSQLVHIRDITRMGRLQVPETMIKHGVSRLVSVPIQNEDLRFGVLQVGSPERGCFDGSDLSFLQALATSVARVLSRRPKTLDWKTAVMFRTEHYGEMEVSGGAGYRAPYQYQQEEQMDRTAPLAAPFKAGSA